jgi:diaminopimelate decarboxylase
MDYFSNRNGTLFCEEINVNKITKEVGTPAYIYSARTIVEHFRKLDKAFSQVSHKICYSAKANGNIAILRLLVKEGAGIDIVSGGELEAAVRAGSNPSKIVFSGVAKTIDEIDAALSKGILFFAVESEEELYRIDARAKALGKTGKFSVRVNPDVDPHTHKHITTGKLENKFGLSPSIARDLYAKSRNMKNVKAVGIHMHVGSQLLSEVPYLQGISKLKELLKEVRSIGIDIKYLDIGGGFGVSYNTEKPLFAEEYADRIIPEVKELGVELLIEPGRFIIANGGILVTQVQYVKENPLKRFVIVDAGMNDLIRPALYDAYHKITVTEPHAGGIMIVDVVGPICESADVLGRGVELPDVKQGDYLAIRTTGAYGFSMSSNYNLRTRAVEVLVQGDRYDVIRERETFDQIFQNQLIPKSLEL